MRQDDSYSRVKNYDGTCLLSGVFDPDCWVARSSELADRESYKSTQDVCVRRGAVFTHTIDMPEPTNTQNEAPSFASFSSCHAALAW